MRELRIVKSEGEKTLQEGFLHSSSESSKGITALQTSRCFATSKDQKLEGGGFLGERFKENQRLDKAHLRQGHSCGKQLFTIQVNRAGLCSRALATRQWAGKAGLQPPADIARAACRLYRA